jgi:hypothetical protein
MVFDVWNALAYDSIGMATDEDKENLPRSCRIALRTHAIISFFSYQFGNYF